MRDLPFVEDFCHDDFEAVLMEEVDEPVTEPLDEGIPMTQAVDSSINFLNGGDSVAEDTDIDEAAGAMDSTTI